MAAWGMIPAYCRDHPEFAVIGERMMAVWDDGVRGMDTSA